MPIYEYRCRACGMDFDLLVRADTRLACPACEHTDLEQLISLFSVSSPSTRASTIGRERQRQRKTHLEQTDADRDLVLKHDH